MTARISHVTVDCTNAYELSEWWKRVLGWTDVPGDPNEPGHEECMIISPDTDERLLFIEVPDFDPSIAKRFHLDLRPRENSRDEELQVLLDLGATQIADHRGIHGPGSGWVVLADPEGNQFCILRHLDEVARSSQH
ncbi:MAG: VOC family protein [Propionibacteriales bacterium]|nr:VOC family protein [Propionibacteriales bacterium]